MDINEINKAISSMVKNSNGGIVSVGVYSSEEDLVVTGSNVDYGISSVSNDLFKSFLNSLKMFNFADSLNNFAITFEDKVFYTGKLNSEFNFTIILDPEKLSFGLFKTILLKQFFKDIRV
jgi:hypothetical protein